MDRTLEDELTLAALQMDIARRIVQPGLVITLIAARRMPATNTGT
jgi:hypothetical protein